jgi:hypothetical protein
MSDKAHQTRPPEQPKEDKEWAQFSLASAQRGMEDEDFSAYDNVKPITQKP